MKCQQIVKKCKIILHGEQGDLFKCLERGVWEAGSIFQLVLHKKQGQKEFNELSKSVKQLIN